MTEKEITEGDLIIINKILELNSLDMGQKNELLRLVRTYIDEGANMCMTCDPQVVAMWRRLKGWFSEYKK